MCDKVSLSRPAVVVDVAAVVVVAAVVAAVVDAVVVDAVVALFIDRHQLEISLASIVSIWLRKTSVLAEINSSNSTEVPIFLLLELVFCDLC